MLDIVLTPPNSWKSLQSLKKWEKYSLEPRRNTHSKPPLLRFYSFIPALSPPWFITYFPKCWPLVCCMIVAWSMSVLFWRPLLASVWSRLCCQKCNAPCDVPDMERGRLTFHDFDGCLRSSWALCTTRKLTTNISPFSTFQLQSL